MKYTKEQLQGMSNKDVNIALARILLDKQGAPYHLSDTVTLTKLEKLRDDKFDDAIEVVCGFGFRLDYCNTPNDIMPLAFEYNIGLQPARNQWQAFSATADFYDDESPLRAIACCLILVLQEGK